jgi:UDP-N-acetylmuramoyl-L-alanyl-D-glutamate--2,6-diaminopimelate ligase
MDEAHTGDIVLLAGKGHENYQILADRTLEFDDREVARRALIQHGYRASAPTNGSPKSGSEGT